MRVGDTVSLRLHTAVGPTEVVGTVLAASADSLTVRRRDGSVVELDVTQITASRLVPPTQAQTVDVAALQRVMAAGWRAGEAEDLGDWLLRAAGGFTGRANSALAVGDPGMPLDAAVDRVEQWYGDRRLPPRIQLPAAGPAGLSKALDARSWHSAWPTHVMTTEVAPVLRALPRPGLDVSLDGVPDDDWLAAYRPDEGRAGSPESVVTSVLTNHPHVVFASIRENGRCVAIARAAVDGRWVGLSCVEVRPDRRRSGLATAVNAAALRWAVQRGARRAYLQVTVDNNEARAFYERLGFAVHHDYVYRSPSTVET